MASAATWVNSTPNLWSLFYGYLVWNLASPFVLVWTLLAFLFLLSKIFKWFAALLCLLINKLVYGFLVHLDLALQFSHTCNLFGAPLVLYQLPTNSSRNSTYNLLFLTFISWLAHGLGLESQINSLLTIAVYPAINGGTMNTYFFWNTFFRKTSSNQTWIFKDFL